MRIFSMKFVASFFLFSFFVSNVQASVFSKFISEAIDGVTYTAPRVTSKALRNELNEKNSNEAEGENKLLKMLSGIDEKTGGMANSITNIIFTYNTPEQKVISKSEYERVRSEFKKRVSGGQYSQAKLIFDINFKCTDYAIEVLTSVRDRMSAGKSSLDLEKPFSELRKCSKYLGVVKGYSHESANSYQMLVEKFSPIIKNGLPTKKEDQLMLVNLFGSVIHSMKVTQDQVRSAGSEWF